MANLGELFHNRTHFVCNRRTFCAKFTNFRKKTRENSLILHFRIHISCVCENNYWRHTLYFAARPFSRYFSGRYVLNHSFMRMLGSRSRSCYTAFKSYTGTFTQVLWTCTKVSRRSKRFHRFLRSAATQLFTTFTRFQYGNHSFLPRFHTTSARFALSSHESRTKHVQSACFSHAITAGLHGNYNFAALSITTR